MNHTLIIDLSNDEGESWAIPKEGDARSIAIETVIIKKSPNRKKTTRRGDNDSDSPCPCSGLLAKLTGNLLPALKTIHFTGTSGPIEVPVLAFSDFLRHRHDNGRSLQEIVFRGGSRLMGLPRDCALLAQQLKKCGSLQNLELNLHKINVREHPVDDQLAFLRAYSTFGAGCWRRP